MRSERLETTHLSCELKFSFDAESRHIDQVVSGFLMLAAQGLIDIETSIVEKGRLPIPHLVEVELGDGKRIAYDLLDGYNWDEALVERYLGEVDYYFKRSYLPSKHVYLQNGSRIRPLGFNYHVTVPGNPLDRVLWRGTLRKTVGGIIRYLRREHTAYFADRFEDIPHASRDARAVFFARLWAPESELGEPALARSESEERRSLNSLRVECIRLLRKEFGPQFVGGLVPTSYARRHYPDLVADSALTARKNFIRATKSSSICIASAGLFQSNGWKLAEYIAASKAIVSEALRYEVPGDFKPESNYLEFKTPEECIVQVARLIGDPYLRDRLQANNYAYYQRFLRPDRLVMNTLIQAIQPTRS
jgi:hypothetical protein